MRRRSEHDWLLITFAIIGLIGPNGGTVAGQMLSRSSMPLGMSSSSMTRSPVGGRGTIRHGGASGSFAVRSAWRAMPSESRHARWSSGMLPSEIRGAAIARGSPLFSGASARIVQRAPTAIRYGGSPAASYSRPTVRRGWSAPPTLAAPSLASPAQPSYRRVGGTMHYGSPPPTTYPPLGTGGRPHAGTAASILPNRPLSQSRVRHPRGTLRYGTSLHSVGLLPGKSTPVPRLRSTTSFLPGSTHPTRTAVGDDSSADAAQKRGPRKSDRVASLPRDNVRIEVGGRTYYRIGWTFYQPQSEEGATFYVEVPPPYGAMLDTLPPKYETAVIDEKPYYRFDGVYFVAVAMDGGTKYVVVQSPEQTAQPDPAEISR